MRIRIATRAEGWWRKLKQRTTYSNENEETCTAKNKRIQIVKIELVRERTETFAIDKVNCRNAAAGVLASFIGEMDRECFVVICLDNRNNVNALNMVSMGTINNTLVHPREVFKAAILSNASRIVVGHNHPSGDTTPSPEDIDVARRLVAAGDVLGIEVLDNLIVGGNGKYLSFEERGLLRP